MSCGVTLAIALMMSNPAIAEAAAVPAAVAGAPVSISDEPFFADIVARSTALRGIVEMQIRTGLAERADFATSEQFSRVRREAGTLAELDMQGHLILEERGTDGDLKCILRGISEDLPRKIADIEAASSPALRAVALAELSYLLDDNAAVITAPPQPPV
jgi:hypothetical protein